MDAAMNVEPAEVVETNQPRVARTEFRIRDERKAWFEGEMARLAKRAAKLGVPAPTYTFGQSEDQVEVAREEVGEDPLTGRPTYHEYEVVRRYWPTTISGEAPKFNGWTIVATIEVLVEGDKREVLVRSITKEALPAKYRDERGASNCDHCKMWRARRETFIVQHDSGELKQVGRQCIRDFLGHRSPEQFAAMAEFILTARELGEGGECGGNQVNDRFPLSFFMGYVAIVMRHHGWVSKKTAHESYLQERPKRPTAGIAFEHMCPPKELLRDGSWTRYVPTEADIARGTDAIEWASNLSDAEVETSDYLHNLRVIARLGIVERRTAGYAASTIIAQDKVLERVRERMTRPESNYVGTVGERIRLQLTVKRVRELTSDWGITLLHLMEDEQGNDFKWFSSSAEYEVGQTIDVDATVKAHDEYKGLKQTTLTRCKPHLDKPKKNKQTKAVAAGIVAAFEALRQDEDTGRGVCFLVAFMLGYQWFDVYHVQF